MKLTAEALNHLLRQNTWAAEQLCAHAGKTIRLDFPPLSSTLTVVDSGMFVPAVTDAAVDATIGMLPLALLRRLTGQSLRAEDIRLEGDTELAAAIGKVLQELQWEFEEDLSRAIGDIPAHELVNLGRRAVTEGKRQVLSLAGMFAEYWLEEQPMIAKRRHLEQFSTEVNTLRDDVERLSKRLQKLESGH